MNTLPSVLRSNPISTTPINLDSGAARRSADIWKAMQQSAEQRDLITWEIIGDDETTTSPLRLLAEDKNARLQEFSFAKTHRITLPMMWDCAIAIRKATSLLSELYDASLYPKSYRIPGDPFEYFSLSTPRKQRVKAKIRIR